MKLGDLQGHKVVDVQVEDNIVKLTFESGQWIKFDWDALWCGMGPESGSSTELRQFIADMKRRRVAQEVCS